MLIPCHDHCYLRYGKQYTKECDTTCDYAKAVKEGKCKDDIIECLLDMLEEQHMGMRAVATKDIKDRFGIRYQIVLLINILKKQLQHIFIIMMKIKR